jgi:hypothetical protein
MIQEHLLNKKKIHIQNISFLKTKKKKKKKYSYKIDYTLLYIKYCPIIRSFFLRFPDDVCKDKGIPYRLWQKLQLTTLHKKKYKTQKKKKKKTYCGDWF